MLDPKLIQHLASAFKIDKPFPLASDKHYAARKSQWNMSVHTVATVMYALDPTFDYSGFVESAGA